MISEFRRTRRRKAADTILVTDTMSERVVGRIGNLSESGMLLMASEPLVDDALYQFRFALPDGRGHKTAIEIGVHLLWTDHASAPGQAWAGFRFIAVDEPHMTRLRSWIESPGGQYE
ncbi:MAG: PilZ domain-containing protein [Luteimonas sp.]